MSHAGRLFFACCLVVVASAAAVPVGADHGGTSDYTVIPHDRQPGNPDATYEQHSVAPITFEYLDFIRSTWHDGGFTGCGPTNNEVFGIDRDDDEPGTATNHDLTQHVEESKVGEDTFEADFYEKDDAFGTSTNLDAGDEFVGLTSNCFDNPDDPGWYQIRATVAGTVSNGSYVEAQTRSHYFYVCDCSSRQEARRELGPPPSADTPTATTTATAEPTPTRTPPSEGTPFPSPTATPEKVTSTPASAPEEGDLGAGGSGDGAPSGSGGGDAGSSAAPRTPTPTPPDWDEFVRETPTVGSGPGVGGVEALLVIVGAGLLAGRRR